MEYNSGSIGTAVCKIQETFVQGKLVICPTPLGNLGDMTQRAIEVLREVDTVCAEDTRVTGKLLAAYGIEGKKLVRLDENMVAKRAQRVVERVQTGEKIAYCTDAGMPGVSDPGLRLVRAAHEANAPIEVLPGPTAVITAYVASGCISPTFYFGGFFPRRDGARIELLEKLAPLDAALIFYDSPNRLADSLKCIKDTLPHRTCAVCRELTKMHEEIVRGSVAEVYEAFANRESIKGEIVIVIDEPSDEETGAQAADAAERAAHRAQKLAENSMSKKDIAKQLAAEFDIPRNKAYEIALACVSGRE